MAASYGHLAIGLGVSALLLTGLVHAGGAITAKRKKAVVNGTEYEITKDGDTIGVLVVGSKPLATLKFNTIGILEASGSREMFTKMFADMPALVLASQGL